MATATPSIDATAGTAPRGRGMDFMRHRLARYLAAVGGLLASLLFFQPWVTASLAGVGETPLSGVQLARDEGSKRVNEAAFGASRPGAGSTPGAAGAAGAGSGGLSLPTRVPTVAAGGAVSGVSGAAAPAATSVPAAAPVGSGGLSLPTRVPTVAAGGTAGFGTSGAVSPAAAPATVVPGAPAATPVARPAAPPAPATLPRFPLYLVSLAGLGIAAFSVIWDRLGDPKDRFAGKLWTLFLSYGGALLTGSVLYRVVNAPAGNVLIGPGVGGVIRAEPALWGVFLAFLLSAVCLTVAWLSPAPPPPDPYARARG